MATHQDSYSQQRSSGGLRSFSGDLQYCFDFLVYALAAAILAHLIWSAIFMVNRPFVGAYWRYYDGQVLAITSGSQAEGLIRSTDRVLSVNGVATSEALYLRGIEVGDTVSLAIERGGQQVALTLAASKAPVSATVQDLPPIVTATFFWAAGLLVYAFSRAYRQRLVFFLFYGLLALALSSGATSALAGDWNLLIYRFAGIWGGGAGIISQLYLLQPNMSQRRFRSASALTLGIPLLLTFAIIAAFRLDSPDLSSAAALAFHTWVAVSLLLIALIPVLAYYRTDSVKTRQQIRFLVFGVIISVAPILFFSVIGYWLPAFDAVYIPAHYTLFLLVLLPIVTGYAALRHKLL
ncbi:MAG: hypothetical protein GYB68_18375, partial [Chloroflexi bacterium]|nr:hypothetical protein [Chloroflexota bacterium]